MSPLLPSPSRIAEICKECSTDQLEVSLVPQEDKAKVDDAYRVVFRSFSEPYYKLMAWMAEPAGDKKEQASHEILSWIVKMCIAYTYETEGFVVRVTNKNTGEVVGAALVAAPFVNYSTNPIKSFFQKFNVEVVTLFRQFFWTVGLPSAITKMRTYGVAHFHRFAAGRTLEDERNKTMVGLGPYFYLQQLATLPEAQGQGIGTVMLKTIGKLADDKNTPVYLETDEPHLKIYYSGDKFKFVCHHEYVVEASNGDKFAPNFAMLRMPTTTTTTTTIVQST
jgi:GNAT superfamily N-acetyltransferase